MSLLQDTTWLYFPSPAAYGAPMAPLSPALSSLSLSPSRPRRSSVPPSLTCGSLSLPRPQLCSSLSPSLPHSAPLSLSPPTARDRLCRFFKIRHGFISPPPPPTMLPWLLFPPLSALSLSLPLSPTTLLCSSLPHLWLSLPSSPAALLLSLSLPPSLPHSAPLSLSPPTARNASFSLPPSPCDSLSLSLSPCRRGPSSLSLPPPRLSLSRGERDTTAGEGGRKEQSRGWGRVRESASGGGGGREEGRRHWGEREPQVGERRGMSCLQDATRDFQSFGYCHVAVS